MLNATSFRAGLKIGVALAILTHGFSATAGIKITTGGQQASDDKPSDTTAPADTCSSVDYRSELPPVRNQGDIGWCYAYVAADMLSQRLKTPVSAFDVAISYNHLVAGQPSLRTGAPEQLADGKSYYEAGYIAGAVNAMAGAGGVCPESIIRSENFLFDVRLQFNSPTAALTYTQSFGDRADKITQREQSACPSKNPVFTLFNDFQVGKILGQSASPEAWYRLAQETCKENRIKVDPDWSTTMMSKGADSVEAMTNEIDNQLSKGLVVGISYDSRFIPRKGKLPKMSVGDSFKKTLRGEVLDPHGSVVVGRKRDPKTQQCLYLIRNSWSSNCRDIANCERGNFWVPRNWLEKNMYGVTHWK